MYNLCNYTVRFNRNMGCIEIRIVGFLEPVRSQFNRNMGCIEMSKAFKALSVAGKFNRNMGCIEILIGTTNGATVSV